MPPLVRARGAAESVCAPGLARTLLDVADTTDPATTRTAVNRALELRIYDQR